MPRLSAISIVSFLSVLSFVSFVHPATLIAADRLSRLNVMGPNWPHAFFFRAAESGAARTRTTFQSWDDTFSRLMGIEGKVLDEEVPGRSRRNIDFFTRFKERHPNQLVLLHFNGNSRDPRDAPADYAAGHWLYYNGARVLTDVPAEPGELDIQVDHPERFLTGIGRYVRDNDDVGLCATDSDSRPDWRQAEQVQLVSVDRKRKTIRVRRGCYGTTPKKFSAGRAYAAAHVAEGPWGNKSHMLWAYNYATVCPRDAHQRQAADALVGELSRWFSSEGKLATFDGLEFDVLGFRKGAGRLRGPDCDADGRSDAGVIGGLNQYGIGVIRFLEKLRVTLGDDRLILADGHSPNAQRGFGILNGIESEGFPALNDPTLRDWSGGLNRHAFWAANGRAPVWNYINHKFVSHGPKPGQTRQTDVPASAHRLVFAAALFTDAAVCYSTAPPREPGEGFGIWDELQQGQAHRLGWLGQPLGPTVHLATQTPNLLKDRRDALLRAFRTSSSNVVAGANVPATTSRLGSRVAPPTAAHVPATAPAVRRFELPNIPCPGGQLVVTLTLSGQPMVGYPSSVARLVYVTAGWGRSLVDAADIETGMQRRGEPVRPLPAEGGASVRYSRRMTLDDVSMPGYFVHPPYGPKRGGQTEKTGLTFWQCSLVLPERPTLSFFTGMGTKAPGRSDGVVFKVQVAGGPRVDVDSAQSKQPGQDRSGAGKQQGASSGAGVSGKAAASAKLGTAAPDEGNWQTVFQHQQVASHWQRHSVSLPRWAGRDVRIRFVADAGPNDNPTTDHAMWGDVRLGSGPAPAELSAPQQIMTWCGTRSFTSTFYFDRLSRKQVDLTVQVEGNEPLTIHRITAHAAPEHVYRTYQHGLVLANLDHRPWQVPLGELAPGRKFQRLKGSPGQDPKTNTGSPVSETVTIPPRDALFLVDRQ